MTRKKWKNLKKPAEIAGFFITFAVQMNQSSDC